jgi:CheY-like chemotaxis protein
VAKALRSAIEEVFGERAHVQGAWKRKRCQACLNADSTRCAGSFANSGPVPGELRFSSMHIARTVLLADDHEEFLAAVVRLLEPHFEVVRTFSNGQALLEEAFQLKPELIVLDISMPVLNGLETAKRLKRLGSHAEIVFLTVHADLDYVHAAFKAGALGYVLKSELASELLFCLREALDGRPFVSPTIAHSNGFPSRR